MTQTTNLRDAFEPTILEAARRFWWIILAGALLGFTGGAGYAFLIANSWEATAIIEVEDPSVTGVFPQGGGTAPDRYVTAQIARIEAQSTMDQAAGLLPAGVVTEDFSNAISIAARPGSNVVEISYSHPDPEAAIAVVNSIAEAYRQARTLETGERLRAALTELDRSIDEVDGQLALIESQIAQLISDSSNPAVDVELSRVVEELTALLNSPPPLGAEAREARTAQIDALIGRISSLQLVRILEPSPSLDRVLDNRAETLGRRTQLVVRRDQLRVDSELTPSGVAHFAPAATATKVTRASRTALAGMLFFAFAGLGVAHSMASRHHRLENRDAPELVLGAPLVGTLPVFKAPADHSSLAVIDNPGSSIAEAFRFAGAGLLARLDRVSAPGDPRVVSFTSADFGQGKTTIIANLAVVAATRGKRVAVIDGNFHDPELSRILLRGNIDRPGITDLASGTTPLTGAVVRIRLPRDATVDVLAPGRGALAAPEFFRSEEARQVFESLAAEYDLVLVDSPPLLHVSYASSIAQLCTHALVIAPHNGSVAALEDVTDRLELIGTEIVGYIYNRAPAGEGALDTGPRQWDPKRRLQELRALVAKKDQDPQPTSE